MIDVELAHPLFPVDMGIDETGKDELAVEIDHLSTSGCRCVRGEDVANHAAFDQERAPGERRIGNAVDDGGAADQKR